MKKIIILICTFLAVMSLAACGNTSKMDSLIENNDKQTGVSVQNTEQVLPDPSVTGDAFGLLGDSESKNSSSDTGSSEYDVDLTALDGTMLYAKVLEMVNNPEDYNGKTVRAEGPFSYFQDPQTKKEYFAVLIADITACCAQGIEFRMDGDYSYPKDYPYNETDITISGVCDIYKEGNSTYMQLLHADYKINE